MKKFTITCFLLSLVFTSTNSIASEKCAQAMGNMIVGKVTMNCLKVKGTAKFNNTTIKENLDVMGSLNATSANLNSLTIKGQVTLDKSKVSGVVNIQGMLEASDTTFGDKILLETQSATFKHSTMKGIKITSTKPATVYLNDQSTVDGDIEFTHGDGIVKNNGSKITGKVIGGKLDK